MIEWVLWNSERLIGHKFYCTGTTGTLIKKPLKKTSWNQMGYHNPEIWSFRRWPANWFADRRRRNRLSVLFTDPMTLQPHDTDVKALTRLAGVENIVFCCNRSTADHIITSPLFTDPTYERIHPDYTNYTQRFENKGIISEAVEQVKSGGIKVRITFPNEL